MVPKSAALELVPQDPGLDVRLGVYGLGVDSARVQPLNEKLEGVWIVFGKGDFVVFDHGV